MEVTIGGDRVGSGKKMKAHLHNYNRSTHNLSETFASSMASGVLYPALCKLGMRGDSFDISINADCRTIPTVGPLFGSYKMQVDVYQCPVRLYQGILHNNPLAIGLKMGQVKFPVMNILSSQQGKLENMKMNTSSLAHYLGLSGLGCAEDFDANCGRTINAIPFLSYYDIFKTYYANKQEEKAYVISGQVNEVVTGTNGDYYYKNEIAQTSSNRREFGEYFDLGEADEYQLIIPMQNWDKIIEKYNHYSEDLNEILITLLKDFGGGTTQNVLQLTFKQVLEIIYKLDPNYILNYYNITEARYDENLGVVRISFSPEWIKSKLDNGEGDSYELAFVVYSNEWDIESKTNLKILDFDLSNIDDMRYDLLSHHTLGVPYTIDYNASLPYSSITGIDNFGVTLNTYPMNGLVLKTYQNDIFNNWLNTEWIEGENSITELTKVAIVDGAFSMDSLNFAQKQYNMLNRIAVAGATYEDWQDVVYEEVKRRQIESPIFVGGMSQEVVFDEIIQTAPADGNPLGTLGGRGKLAGNKKGGKIHVKCDEACFIIALVSLTPRIYYTQGNEFYLTDVMSMEDMHKPPMDGIGFQDLIGERLAWFDTVLDDTGNTTTVKHRTKIGKLPAWIEYMTSYDRAHGDFADNYAGYMILSRRYELDEETGYGIKDVTTYVDPQKYNYAFAYQNLDAQNFWIQIGFNIKARRLMSARLIPNV